MEGAVEFRLEIEFIFSFLPSSKIKVKITLRLAVYRQSVRLGAKPLEDHDQNFFTETLWSYT
jgi:hypothetical protein